MTDSASVVDCLRSLVVFGPDQAGAYRELASNVLDTLGRDVPTKLMRWLGHWATTPDPGLVILTGNAGTGKTAATEHFCRMLGQSLPESDELTELDSALVVKDASGIESPQLRAEMFTIALEARHQRKILLCVNEGILRDAARDLETTFPEVGVGLDASLRDGAHIADGITVVNLNRQRLTSEALWEELLNYVSRDSLWSGCDACPGADDGDVCPMRANALALRQPGTRTVLRRLIQLCSGEMTPTIRELLSLLSYSVVGIGNVDALAHTWTCETVAQRYRDRGMAEFTTDSAYYNLFLGEGIDDETRERLPLLDALRRLGCGSSSDLQVDGWLRDPAHMSDRISALSGLPPHGAEDTLSGSNSHLDRIRTSIGERTYAEIGETVVISELPDEVQACIRALVFENPPPSAIASWRRRVLFEASDELGGPDEALKRLSSLAFGAELLELASTVAKGDRCLDELIAIVEGLNFLTTGQTNSADGLFVPDPASLFARNPGAFRVAEPTFIESHIAIDQLRLDVPDRGVVERLLDVDHVEVTLFPEPRPDVRLTIGPRLYQAIAEANRYRGPVGHGVGEMTELRSFFGNLADLDEFEAERYPVVADPSERSLVRIRPPFRQS